MLFRSSRGQANIEEIALRASGTVGSTKIAAALATGGSNGSSAGDNPVTVTAISGSALLKNGLNFTLSLSSTETDVPVGTDPSQTYSYFKVGYMRGKHAVSLAISQTDNDTGVAATDDANPTSVALAYVYKLAKDVEVYAAYRDVDADDQGLTSGSLGGVSSMTVGSRIRWK